MKVLDFPLHFKLYKTQKCKLARGLFWCSWVYNINHLNLLLILRVHFYVLVKLFSD